MKEPSRSEDPGPHAVFFSWVRRAGRKGGISESDAIAFDFNSVGIWTCTNSCFDGSETTCVREEEVFVATDGIDQSVLAKLAAAI